MQRVWNFGSGNPKICKILMQENGGTLMLKLLLTKQISWACHHKPQMLILSMGSQGRSSCVLKNVKILAS